MQRIYNFFKRLAKKKSFWIILVVVILAIIIIGNLTKGKKVEYVTEKVTRGNLVQSVSETGAIESASAIDLNFKGTGTLKEINVSEGAEVKSGDILARLESGSLEIAVKQAQANLAIARANLNRLLIGASKEDINVTQESVNNAKIAYESAATDYQILIKKIEADLVVYQQNIEAAQTALTNAKNSNSKNVSDAKTNLLTTIRGKTNTANTALDFINYQYNNLGNVSDQQAKANTWTYYSFGRGKQTSLTNLLNKSDQSMSDDDIIQTAKLAIGLFEDINTSLNSLFNTISSTMVDSRYSQTLVDNYKALVKAEQTNASANLLALQNADQIYKTAQLTYTSAVDTATASLNTNQNNLNSAIANKDLQLAQAKANVDASLGAYNLAKAQLALKKALPRQVEIASYVAQVNQALAAVELAQNNLNDYIIIAPKDGVVTFVNYKVGEQIGFSSGGSGISKPAIAMLSKADFQIKVDVPESDIVKVKVGNKAKITLDAYGNSVEFLGEVISIDVAESVIQDVVYYKVIVRLETNANEIKSGMTANVDLITATKENVLVIPSRSIKEDDQGKKYVETLSFGNPKRLDITTGLKGDEGTEVLSGLKEGEIIIIYKK